ncbi:MAG: hypothetical protein KAH04_00215 [Psychrilyobacter sp.]|nr:hypothetical protein [Psychrilyobacter sp.]
MGREKKSSLSLVILKISLFLIFSISIYSSPLRIGVTSNFNSETVKFINNLDTTLEIEIIYYNNYEIMNSDLLDKKIDITMFQTLDFLEEYNKKNKTNLLPLVEMYVESMGIYSLKHNSIKGVSHGSTIIIPEDTSNQKRALEFLETMGLIKLNPIRTKTAIRNIISNPFNLEIVAVASNLMTRYLEVADYVVLNGEIATNEGYNPEKDSLALENFYKKYINVLVTREKFIEDREVVKFSELLKSKETKLFILMKYGNNISFME